MPKLTKISYNFLVKEVYFSSHGLYEITGGIKNKENLYDYVDSNYKIVLSHSELQEIDEVFNANGELEKANKQLAGENEHLQNALTYYIDDVKNLQNKLSCYQENIKFLTAERDRVQEELIGKINEINEANKDINRLEHELVEAKKEIERLKKELDEKRSPKPSDIPGPSDVPEIPDIPGPSDVPETPDISGPSNTPEPPDTPTSPFIIKKRSTAPVTMETFMEFTNALKDTSIIDKVLEASPDNAYSKLLEKYKINIDKKLSRMDFDDDLRDNLDKIIRVIHEDLAKKIILGLYRAYKSNSCDTLERNLLTSVVEYLRSNGFYSRSGIEIGNTISDDDYADMNVIVDKGSKGRSNNEIVEIMLYPYYVDYIDDNSLEQVGTEGMIAIAG